MPEATVSLPDKIVTIHHAHAVADVLIRYVDIDDQQVNRLRHL